MAYCCRSRDAPQNLESWGRPKNHKTLCRQIPAIKSNPRPTCDRPLSQLPDNLPIIPTFPKTLCLSSGVIHRSVALKRLRAGHLLKHLAPSHRQCQPPWASSRTQINPPILPTKPILLNPQARPNPHPVFSQTQKQNYGNWFSRFTAFNLDLIVQWQTETGSMEHLLINSSCWLNPCK
jgi:hypothetical protein